MQDDDKLWRCQNCIYFDDECRRDKWVKALWGLSNRVRYETMDNLVESVNITYQFNSISTDYPKIPEEGYNEVIGISTRGECIRNAPAAGGFPLVYGCQRCGEFLDDDKKVALTNTIVEWLDHVKPPE